MSKKNDMNKILSHFDFNYTSDFNVIKQEINITEKSKVSTKLTFKSFYSIVMTSFVFILSIALICVCVNQGNNAYTNEKKYKLDVIDNFNFIAEPLEEEYAAGEEVTVGLKTMNIEINGIKLNDTNYYGEWDSNLNLCIVKFNMPKVNSKLYTISNNHINLKCSDDNHIWQEDSSLYKINNKYGISEKVYTCITCFEKKYVPYETNGYKLATLSKDSYSIADNNQIVFDDILIESVSEYYDFIGKINNYSNVNTPYFPSKKYNEEYFSNKSLIINLTVGNVQYNYRENVYYKFKDDNKLEINLFYETCYFGFDFSRIYQNHGTVRLIEINRQDIMNRVIEFNSTSLFLTLIPNISVSPVIPPNIVIVPEKFPDSIFNINENSLIYDGELELLNNVICSVEELEKFISYFNISDDEFSKYDEQYFENNTLVIFNRKLKYELKNYDLAITNYIHASNGLFFSYKEEITSNFTKSSYTLYKLIEVPNTIFNEKITNVGFLEDSIVY